MANKLSITLGFNESLELQSLLIAIENKKEEKKCTAQLELARVYRGLHFHNPWQSGIISIT